MGLLGAGTVCSAFSVAIAAGEPQTERPAIIFAAVVCTLIFGVALAKQLYEPSAAAA